MVFSCIFFETNPSKLSSLLSPPCPARRFQSLSAGWLDAVSRSLEKLLTIVDLKPSPRMLSWSKLMTRSSSASIWACCSWQSRSDRNPVPYGPLVRSLLSMRHGYTWTILNPPFCWLNPMSFGLGLVEGSLEVKLPTIWRDEKAVSREKSQKRKDQKKEDAGARKGRKVAKHCVFSWLRRVEK